MQNQVKSLSSKLDRFVPEFVTDKISASAILFVSILLPLLVALPMSSWSTRGYWPDSGRYSPYAAHGAAPRVSDADFTYLREDELEAPGSDSRYAGYADRGQPHHVPRTETTNPLAPDILVLRHKGTFYPLHFPAFSIAEGDLSVGELRRLAARETACHDERRVKLLYKGRALKDNRRPCRDEGLKQNSEIMCVVSDVSDYPNDRGQYLEEPLSTSESGEDDDSFGEGRGVRADIDGTIVPEGGERRRRKGHRSGRRRKNRGGDSQKTSPRTSGYLHPEPSHPSHHSREPSPSRSSTHVPLHKPPTPTPTPRPVSMPESPEGKLEAISRTFHSTFVPQCIQYMNNPPPAKKDRDFDYKKLSEGILAQVILKLDEVQSDDQAVRDRRKELVKETQQMLGKLDEVGKAP